MKKIIAKTNIGTEYMYSKRYTYQVSNKNCNLICDCMNKEKYNLSGNEIWKVYTVDEYDYKNAFYRATINHCKIRIYQVWNAW